MVQGLGATGEDEVLDDASCRQNGPAISDEVFVPTVIERMFDQGVVEQSTPLRGATLPRLGVTVVPPDVVVPQIPPSTLLTSGEQESGKADSTAREKKYLVGSLAGMVMCSRTVCTTQRDMMQCAMQHKVQWDSAKMQIQRDTSKV